MAKRSIALAELVKKRSNDYFVRDLPAHVVRRVMHFEIKQRCGAEFPSIIRLVGGPPLEQNDEWQFQRPLGHDRAPLAIFSQDNPKGMLPSDTYSATHS